MAAFPEQGADQPTDRDREAVLLALDDRRRQIAAGDLLEDVFSGAAPQLQRHRQRAGVFGEVAVEKRGANFQAVEHRCAVGLGENVVGQIGDEKQMHQPLERRQIAGFGGKAVERREGGIDEWESGSPSLAVIASQASRRSRSPSSTISCRTPRCRATAAACGVSSKPLPAIRTVKAVVSGEACIAIAATRLESTPPDRNTPTGTSAIRRRRTESRSNSSRRSAAVC